MQGEGTVAEVLAGEARFAVVCGDAAEVLRTIGDGTVAAVVTDPPSGIAFMGAEWDRDKGGRAQWVAWLAGILADARRCTRDGGRSVVWSLPRTSHWTGCAVEDAGWSIENTVTHLFGTGWPKGKSQLKPAAETWWLGRNGRSEPLNVEACRVGASKRVPSTPPSAPNAIYGARPVSAATGDSDGYNPNVVRYPPNVVFSHAPGCARVGERKVKGTAPPGPNAGAVAFGLLNDDGWTPRGRTVQNYTDPDGAETVEAWECVEGCPVAELDAQSGDRPPGWFSAKTKRGIGYGGHAVSDDTGPAQCIGDTGGASRFFPQFPADPAVFRYVAKPSSAEKEEGVGVAPSKRVIQTGRQLNPVCLNTGERGQRCKCGACVFDRAAEPEAGNDHPTVKSIALMRWLVDLVTQRGDVVLDPFAGSGTTGVACLASGRRVILVERDPRFAEIARQRCAHWGAEWSALAKVSQRKARAAKGDEAQPSLFGDGAR